jgi:hypothetical protein
MSDQQLGDSTQRLDDISPWTRLKAHQMCSEKELIRDPFVQARSIVYTSPHPVLYFIFDFSESKTRSRGHFVNHAFVELELRTKWRTCQELFSDPCAEQTSLNSCSCILIQRHVPKFKANVILVLVFCRCASTTIVSESRSSASTLSALPRIFLSPYIDNGFDFALAVAQPFASQSRKHSGFFYKDAQLVYSFPFSSPDPCLNLLICDCARKSTARNPTMPSNLTLHSGSFPFNHVN